MPLRSPPELAATLKVMVALPFPPGADVSVIQGALLAAVQAHVAAVVSVTLPGPPVSGSVAALAVSK